MNILALTDIHGSYKKAADIIRTVSADIVLIGGDLTTVGSVREVEQALKEFSAITNKLLCVAGNMDLPEHDDLFTRLGLSINGRGVMIDDVGFFGVSGGPYSPLHTPYELSEEEISRRIEAGYGNIQQSRVKVFVPHAPPYATKVDIIHSGLHVGSAAVRDFIDREKPDVVICGHIHEARGLDSIGRTQIANCGPAASGYFTTIEINNEIVITNHSFASYQRKPTP